MVKNRLNGAAKWIVVGVAVLTLIVGIVIAYKNVEACAASNKDRLDKHETWIEAQAENTTTIKTTLAEIKTMQGENGKRLERIERRVNGEG